MSTVNAISGDATKRSKFSNVFCKMTYTKAKLVKEKATTSSNTGGSCNKITAPSNQKTVGDCGSSLTSGSECTPVCADTFTLSAKSTCKDGVFTQGICTLADASCTFPNGFGDNT